MKTNPTQRPVGKHSEQLNSQSPKTINITNVLLLVSGKMNLKYIPTQNVSNERECAIDPYNNTDECQVLILTGRSQIQRLQPA